MAHYNSWSSETAKTWRMEDEEPIVQSSEDEASQNLSSSDSNDSDHDDGRGMELPVEDEDPESRNDSLEAV